MSEESNEITITRAQLLKRLALFLLAVSVILLIVFCIKFIRFLSIDPTDYEEVDVQVIDFESKEVGLEGFPRAAYDQEYYVTVKYEDKNYRYQINDSYATIYSPAAGNPFVTVKAYKYKDEIYPSPESLRAKQNPGIADKNFGILIFFIITAIVDVITWAEYKKEVCSKKTK